MEQYFTVKDQYPNTLLFFQVGDFYELFFDDAKLASSFLAITLTKRGKNKGEDVPLCGIPVHTLNHYLTKLIKGGFRVAICDQLTKPIPGTVVQRGVTQVFTPGTLTDSALLDEKSASYLLSFHQHQDRWALIFSEVLTAQLFATTVPAGAHRAIESELIRFFPDEVLIPKTKQQLTLEHYFKQLGYNTTATPYDQDKNTATSLIEKQFPSHVIKKLVEQPAIYASLDQLLAYFKKNQSSALEHFRSIHFYEPEDYLILDSSTQKNLDLVKNTNDGSNKHTLFAVMDCAKTPMASRTIKKWIQRPLVQKASIEQRLDLVAAIASNIMMFRQLEHLLSQLSDLERIIGRIALGRASLNDYLILKKSLIVVPAIKTILVENMSNTIAAALCEKMNDFNSLANLLESGINDDSTCPGTIKKGFDCELDRLRTLLTGSKQAIITLENQEISATGISSLKIGYTDISGYYIEVTTPNFAKIPERFEHKQTLVNRKRFITSELKALEADLFKAHNEISAIEAGILDRIKQDVKTYLHPLRQLAQSLAYLDGIFGLAFCAYHHNYKRPIFNNHQTITIKNGRHPIVERVIGSAFISNETTLNNEQSLLVITGPNMGGKSTYLRQVALICIMAQCGSFVPAEYAELSIFDRIFTRIGAGDNVAEGKSTFLVEMEEAATICTQATRKSLVILDEVGRGTSTFDGMAIAQAIVEYIAQNIGAHCLFATHYHELTLLSKSIPNIANYHADCKKANNAIIFLHKIIAGAAQGSFGVEVAKLANLPEAITLRATQLLQSMEQPTLTTQTHHNKEQLFLENEALQKKYTELVSQIDVIDFDTISPRQAFDLLWNIKKTLH